MPLAQLHLDAALCNPTNWDDLVHISAHVVGKRRSKLSHLRFFWKARQPLELEKVQLLGEGSYGRVFGVTARTRGGRLLYFCAKVRKGREALDEAQAVRLPNLRRCRGLLPVHMAHPSEVAVLPWVLGSLGQHQGALTLTQAVKVSMEVRRALACLGKHGLHYLDVNDANVLLGCRGSSSSSSAGSPRVVEVFLGDVGSLVPDPESGEYTFTYRLPAFWAAKPVPGRSVGLRTQKEVEAMYDQLVAVLLLECTEYPGVHSRLVKAKKSESLEEVEQHARKLANRVAELERRLRAGEAHGVWRRKGLAACEVLLALVAEMPSRWRQRLAARGLAV